jgi:phosphoribosylaminoimidazole-succinocarboxamide synthase
MITPHVVTDTASRQFTPTRKGKVRDIYDLGDSLLIVATDRLSAFDVVFPDGIPDKGKVLTQISAFWFERLSHIVPHHLLTLDVLAYPEPFRSAPEIFAGRSMLVRKTAPLAVECVVRGYLSGSGWREYCDTKSICGIKIPAGLKESDRLPEAIFTPSTKEEQGKHDRNISFQAAADILGETAAAEVQRISLALYHEAAEYAATRGIIIADTKFEFGCDEAGNLIWIDEALTPDSSRFWPNEAYKPGGPQPSFDKQFVRDYVVSVKWNKQPPAPRLPENIITTTSQKYRDALVLLTGRSLQ